MKEIMKNYCGGCGKTIPRKWYLCADCVEIYGLDKTKWPQWLLEYTRSIHREVMYEYRHSGEWTYDDGFDYTDKQDGVRHTHGGLHDQNDD